MIMSNMSYCRFENTLSDLLECYDNMDDDDLSETEARCRIRLIQTCRNMLEDYEHEIEE